MARQNNLLLVEDDPVVRAALAQLLRAERYEVLCAASGNDAVALCSREQVDVALLDLKLGDEDGWEVFHALKALREDLPIIVTSAHTERLAHASAAGASAMLEKPFDVGVLLDLLTQVTQPRAGGAVLKRAFANAALMLFTLCFPFLARAQYLVVAPTFKITSLQVQGGNVIVNWQGGGTTNRVQSATSPAGPWANVGAPTNGSSIAVPMTGPVAFYRVMQVVGGGSPDATPPTVSLSSPANGSTLTGTVTLTASATDSPGGSGVARVEYYCDGSVPLGTNNSSPYNVATDTTKISNGNHSLYAKAYDDAGNVAASASVNVAVNNASAAPGQLQWVGASSALAGNNAIELAVAADRSGNSVAVGYFSGTVTFGTTTLSSGNTMNVNAFIAKYDSQGRVLWARQLGEAPITNNGIEAFGVAVDSQGNIIVTGYFSATVNFGGTSLTATAGPGDPADIFVAKYSPTGILLWATAPSGSLDDRGIAVAVDGSDNVVLVAQYMSSPLDFGGGHTLTDAGTFNTAVVKLSGANGSTLWASSIGGANSQPYAVAVDRSGDVVVGGGYYNGNLAKFSGANGSLLWTRATGGTVYGVATDPNTGNIITTGVNAQTIFLNGFDPNGATLWTLNNYSSDPNSEGRAVAVDANGNLVFTGKDAYGLRFSGTTVILGNGQANAFMAAFTLSGNNPPVYRWAKLLDSGTTGSSGGTGIALDPLGHILVGGWYSGTTEFEGTSVNVPGGYNGAFTAQYTP